MMFRLTSVGSFLLVIVFLNLVVLTNACDLEGMFCMYDFECCLSECCMGICAFGCTKRAQRQKLLRSFGQR
uniref:Conotoxin Lt11.6 n=1 Tax=Conus litteratus TaxID=89445 RepID=I2B6_CONLT|nr:RecName: Full=Conotoxin Lt11.6; Flags: Precursor [Conus litteratus]ACU30734.1 I-superfamily 11.6 [Conus litteratus]